MEARPFFPVQEEALLFALYADDPTIYLEKEKLTATPKAQMDFILRLLGMFQSALRLVGKEEDTVLLFDCFEEGEGRALLDWQSKCFDMLLVPRVKNLLFANSEDYYKALAQMMKEHPLVTLSAVNHDNYALAGGSQFLSISQVVNSKMELARNASRYQIPVPKSLVLNKAQLKRGYGDGFMDELGEFFVKISGNGGAFNVRKVTSLEEALAFLEEYPESIELVLQEALDSSKYKEMTCDFWISDKEIRIDNYREVLVVDGMWVGNHLQEDIAVSAAVEKELLKCAQWLQDEGHCHSRGYIAGADFFLDGDDVKVIEINGRWTGGQVTERVIRKLGIGKEDVWSFMDRVTPGAVSTYQSFVETYLHGVSKEAFSIVPLGVNPESLEDKGVEFKMHWLLVIGDIQAFVEKKRSLLGDELPTSEKISERVYLTVP